MEIVLFMIMLAANFAIMLVALKYEPLICNFNALVGIVLTLWMMNEGVLTDTNSGYSTSIYPMVWIPTLLIIINFTLGIKAALNKR